AWRRWRGSARSGARSSRCATSPAWSSPRSPACSTSPSAPSTANGSARAPSCRPCSTTTPARREHAASRGTCQFPPTDLVRKRMDPETLAHWQAADAAFDRWLDLPDAERDAWLAAEDLPEPVRRRLVQLIAAHEQPRVALDPAGSNLAGCRLGDWTLDTELGRGGMAVVYRAWREDGMARQQAAVKILTLGAMGAAGRERFRREATILARLNHPNVTTLIDSGVAGDGTCWLAMPLVDG